MQEQIKIPGFDVFNTIGEGSFSKLVHAFNIKHNRHVALKIEKEDKIKKILKAEFDILQALQGCPHIPKVHGFIENTEPNSHFLKQNCIEMELLGKNISNFKKTSSYFTSFLAYDILLQALKSIENLHNRGYIHRDIKPTNFVLGQEDEANLVNLNNRQCQLSPVNIYMVDFGLAKIHLDRNGNPIPQRADADFKGTLTYASLNAHCKRDLSRRDDLWSFFFMILDLLNENLPWRNFKDNKDEIKLKKEQCLKNPQANLFLTTTKGKKELFEIYQHLSNLDYEEKPNYHYIHSKLSQMRNEDVANYNYKNYCQMIYWNHMNLNSNQLIFPNLNMNMTNDTNQYPCMMSSYQPQQPQPQLHLQPTQDQIQAQAFFNSQVQQLSQPNYYNLLGAGREIPFKAFSLNNYNQPYDNPSSMNNLYYNSLLNRKTNRDEEIAAFNRAQETNSAYRPQLIPGTNNVTINNPTQHQIVIINQFPDPSNPISNYLRMPQVDNKQQNKDKEKIDSDYDQDFNNSILQSKPIQTNNRISYSNNNYFFKEHYEPATAAPKAKKEEGRSGTVHNVTTVNNSTCNNPPVVPSYQYKDKIDMNNDKSIINSIVKNLPQVQHIKREVTKKTERRKQARIEKKKQEKKKKEQKQLSMSNNDIAIQEEEEENEGNQEKKEIFSINKIKKEEKQTQEKKALKK